MAIWDLSIFAGAMGGLIIGVGWFIVANIKMQDREKKLMERVEKYLEDNKTNEEPISPP